MTVPDYVYFSGLMIQAPGIDETTAGIFDLHHVFDPFEMHFPLAHGRLPCGSIIQPSVVYRVSEGRRAVG